MSVSTLTSKGQITIPKKLRDQLHLEVGDRLDFQVEPDGTIRLRPIVKKVVEVYGAFVHRGQRHRTDDQIRGEVADAFRDGTL